MSEKAEKKPVVVTRCEFVRAVRMPVTSRESRMSWSASPHEAIVCEMGPGGSVVLTGAAGTTIVPGHNVVSIESFTP